MDQFPNSQPANRSPLLPAKNLTQSPRQTGSSSHLLPLKNSLNKLAGRVLLPRLKTLLNLALPLISLQLTRQPQMSNRLKPEQPMKRALAKAINRTSPGTIKRTSAAATRLKSTYSKKTIRWRAMPLRTIPSSAIPVTSMLPLLPILHPPNPTTLRKELRRRPAPPMLCLTPLGGRVRTPPGTRWLKAVSQVN